MSQKDDIQLYILRHANKLAQYRVFFIDVTILGGHIFCKSGRISFEQFMMKGS